MDCKVPLRVYSILMLLIVLVVASGCKMQSESKVFPVGTASCSETAVKTRYIVKKKNGRIVRVNAKSREEMLEKYVRPKLDELEYVEADQIIYANDYFVSGDVTPTALETWGVERIQAQSAWDQNIKGAGVLVAVIDSGVDITHPSLSSQIYTNSAEANGNPGVDDDQNGFIDDVHGWDFALENPINNDTSGHGTHVAGVIAGIHSNPIKGVAPKAKILPLDFMDGGSGYTSDAIESIEYAKLMNAKVINASWGSSFCSKILKESIDSLVEKNILFVTAAGNSGNNLSYSPEYPAAYISSAQITVGAITKFGLMASYSNFSPEYVDVMAPGDEILSTYLAHDYMYLSGTSMAAPMVSGVAALLISQRPAVNVSDLKNVILNSVIKRNYAVRTEGEVSVPQAMALLNSL